MNTLGSHAVDDNHAKYKTITVEFNQNYVEKINLLA